MYNCLSDNQMTMYQYTYVEEVDGLPFYLSIGRGGWPLQA